MDDVNLRHEFHRALDAVAPPAPWLADHVRQELRRRTHVSRPSQKRTGLGLTLTPAVTALVAALLIMALAIAAVGVTLALFQFVRHPIPVIPHGAITRGCGQGIYMVDANIGWQGTTRTSDGGKTWRDVSPPLLPGAIKGPQSTCALDANHAWAIASSGTVPYQPEKLTVLSTLDGGRSWQQGGVIAVPVATSWRINFSAELAFLDDQDGWLLMEYASTPMFRQLYATSDGGAHWAVAGGASGLGLGNIGLGCGESGLMFVSLQRGWMTWNCSGGYGDQPPQIGPVIAGTNDGGRTWAPVALEAYDPTGRICGATTPIFSRSQGVLQVMCGGSGQSPWAAVYSTADAGQTWTVHVLPVFVSVDFVDGTTGFYFHRDGKGSTLDRTTDGGRDWTVVSSGLFPGNDVATYKFIDATTGFANVSSSPVPYWTHDGGKTWSLPGANRVVGSVVCTLPADAGAGSVPVALKMVSATVGWAAGARRTTDGGATWSRVGPPAAKDSTAGYGEFFLDDKHAWVAEAVGSTTACADHLVVFSTVDGGAKWNQGALVSIKPPASDPLGTWKIQLDFVDPNHGWLSAVAYGWQAPLYRTVDGGSHWSAVAAPASFANKSGCSGFGLPVFSSPATGWMSTRCGDGTNPPLAFLVTHDGGATWSAETLMPSLCCSASPPAFFDAANGWLFEPTTPLLMMTTDGGHTWTQHGLPQLAGYPCTGKHGENMTCRSQAFNAASFADPGHGWVIISQFSQQKGGPETARFARTVDGGNTWTELGSAPALSQPVLIFVDRGDGFLWTGTALLNTTDGGQTWKAVQVTYR